jgi:mono/diheme cytochrome c family protein
MRIRHLLPLALALPVAGGLLLALTAAPRPVEAAAGSETSRAAAVAAFATVQKVLQHPRCQNCHIPGDQPLQFDAGLPHAQGVIRGAKGNGAKGLPCGTCHGAANPPASYGPHAPPGAPHWQLPPPERKMVTIGLSGAELCAMLKDKKENGGRDFAALIEHVDQDKLVLWGWSPGGTRAPVSVPHADFVAAFKLWAAAGGPCPAP